MFHVKHFISYLGPIFVPNVSRETFGTKIKENSIKASYKKLISNFHLYIFYI